MFLVLPPAPKLTTLVHAYWFVEDLPGDHAGRLIRTSPAPLAVLSINMGRPNAAEDGSLVPGVSFLGLQSRSRAWRSWSDTCFVMMMLTIPGMIRLFPHAGSGTADMLLDLAALTGEATARSLKAAIAPEQDPRKIAAFLDQWLISRMAVTDAVSHGGQIVSAHAVLKGGGTVERAALAAGMGRRQLHRVFVRHLGMGPKELSDLERLHASLKGVQTGRGGSLQGFSDQAHQIRSWQRRLGVTPGAYARQPRTPLAGAFGVQDTASGIAYYL
jgi:AraC-like DNA-binding protein